jgi:hypothetical protein
MQINFIKYLFLGIIFFSSCEKKSVNDTESSQEEIISVSFPELGSDGPYELNKVYNGVGNYTTYYPGNSPIILSAPHGGDLTPDDIPNRTWGTTVTDTNTKQLTLAIMNFLDSNYNIKPHVIINNLKRTKLDANRDKAEAAQGDISAERAYDEYHYYISKAKEKILTQSNDGLFLDIHGHGQNPDGFYDLRTWLGYLLSSSELDQSDEELDTEFDISKSSIYGLVNKSSEKFSEVLRGPNSFGNLLEERGYESLPSIVSPSPEGMRYFSGGYNTYVHGSAETGGSISSIQLEMPAPGIRQNATQWNDFAQALSEVLITYFKVHLNIDLIE